MKIDIVMFNMSTYSDWQKGIQNRNFHIFKNFKNNKNINKILLIDFLPFNYKQVLKIFMKNFLLKNKRIILKPNLFSSCFEIEKNKVFLYSTVKNFFGLDINKQINQILKDLEFNNVVLWSCNPMYVKFKNISYNKFVFDSVDNWLEHNSFKKYKKILEQNYKYITEKADIIFSVSKNHSLFYKNLGYSKKIYYIPNGFDLEEYKKQSNKDLRVEFLDKIKSKYKVIIGYIGVMQENRIDVDLLDKIAVNFPDCALVLCGPVWKNMEKIFKKVLYKHNNVFFPGFVPRNQFYIYCKYFDIAINPHLKNKFIKYTSPTKLFEYLACEKPVVTTQVTGSEDLKDFVYISKDHSEFIEYLKNLLLKKESKSQDFAKHKNFIKQNHSWQNRVNKIVDIIIKN